MATFNILHLTDLHWGLSDQELKFPNIRTSFYKDLEKIKHTGPWDLVLFSGDLVQSGKKDQFESLNKFLDGLWNEFKKLDSTPLLLAIPGNHDLDRPNETEPIVILLAGLAKHENPERIWRPLLNESDSSYHKLIYNVFDAYLKWWENTPYKKNNSQSITYHMGVIPGDFVATIEKEGIKLGIAGLNSTFLQLTNDNFERRLAVDVRQFHNAAKNSGEEDGESWVNNHHACILMTHQPPSWLEVKNEMEFYQLIAKAGNFIVQFCGHLHKAKAGTRSQGFSLERRLMQGGALFGFGEEDKVINAYAACRIEIDKTKPKGIVRFWPRLATIKQDNSLLFSPDHSFTLEEDNGTRSIEFDLNIRPKTGGNVKPASSNFQLPVIPPLPSFDLNALYNKQFIGREDLLRDLKNAIRSITNGRLASMYEEEAKLIWVHGFGGMGKSWFLRKACLEAMALSDEIKVALIDWYIPEWYEPASPPFSDPRMLFEIISIRLAQLYGVNNLIKFWESRHQVQKYAQQYNDLRTNLELALDLLEIHGPNWKSEFIDIIKRMSSSKINNEDDEGFLKLKRLERILREQGLWNDDKVILQKVIKEIQKYLNGYDIIEDNNTEAYRNILPAWIHECTQSEDIALLRPYLLLSKSLQECIRDLCAKAPLMIALDTCELLPTAVDECLRKTFIPLLNEQISIILLIGSRHKPDLHINPGLNRGWKVEVDSTRFRSMPFYEEVRFDVSEITKALQKANIRYSLDELPYLLHQVTLGVPLALGTILQLHNDGDKVLEEIRQLKSEAGNELNSKRAISLVIETISKRFLLHLENRSDRIKDYKNIIALALLNYFKMDVLIQIWGETYYITTLKALARKYALLADGDLHPTVQDFLKRYWREQPSELVIEVANDLYTSLQECKPEGFIENKKYLNWRLEELNLMTWIKQEESFNELIKTLILFLTYGVDIGKLADIAKSCPVKKNRYTHAKEIFDKIESDDYYLRTILLRLDTESLSWIKNNFANSWSGFENTCLDLLISIDLSNKEENLKAVKLFINCFLIFKEKLENEIPRQTFMVQTFLGSIAKLDQELYEVAEEGLQILTTLGILEISIEWNIDYYWLLHNSKRYQAAADYCKYILDHNPLFTPPIAFLGHNLDKHLGKSDEAESVYKKGIAAFPKDPSLHFFLGELYIGMGKLEPGIDEYKEALKYCSEQGPNSDQILPEIIDVLLDLKQIEEAKKYLYKISILKDNIENISFNYRNNERSKKNNIDKAILVVFKFSKLLLESGQKQEAEKTLKLLDNIKIEDASNLNSLAWAQYLLNKLNDAEKNALKSYNLDTTNIHSLQTLIAIWIRKGKWIEAKPKLIEWTTRINIEEITNGWHDFQPMFVDILNNGHMPECIEIIDQFNNDNVWSTLKLALLSKQIPENLPNSNPGASFTPPEGFTFETYCNGRFGYCIDFPKDFFYPQPESGNGDGRIFTNKQGAEVLRVYGRNNVDPDEDHISLQQQFQKDLQATKRVNNTTVTYQKLGKTFFVISGLQKGKIFYQKTILQEEAFAYAILQYDPSEKATYNTIAERMFQSFK